MNLGLEVQVASPDGSNARTLLEYTSDPRQLAKIGLITTKLNTGFESATVQTERDQRLTYSYPRILQEMKIKGAGSRSAFEGRVTKTPVGRNDDVSAAGWWDALKDNAGVAEVYSDKSYERWSGCPTDRQAALLALNYTPTDGSVDSGGLKIMLAQPAWTNPGLPITVMCYTAPAGVNLASFTATATRTTTNWGTGDANFSAYAGLTNDDDLSGGDATSDFSASLAGYSISVTGTGTARRFAFIQGSYDTTYGTSDSTERSFLVTDPTLKGDHGLTNIYASEVIKHAIGKYCPLLSASTQIEDTSYAIGQLVFDGQTVADVVQRVNAFHLWRFHVYENRECIYAPQRDLTDYDYEIPFQGDFKGDLLPAGPEVDDDEPANGVWVYYTNVQTGRQERVGPYGTSAPFDTDGDASLLATTETNAANREGQNRFPRLDISFQCTRADAIQMGSIWLAEKQTKFNAGSGTTGGYVKNRAGAWVPAYEIRAGDRVRYSHEVNTIREVYATSYDPASFTNTLTFEKPDSTFEGINERVQMSLQAALGGGA